MKKRFSKFFGTRQFYKLALAVAVPLMMQQLITSSDVYKRQMPGSVLISLNKIR